MQIPPLPAEFLKVLPNLPKITLQQKHSLSTSDDQLDQTPVHCQDCTPVDINPQWDYRPLALSQISPPQTTEQILDHHPQLDTPVNHVKPFLGTTIPENHQLQTTNQPQDISEILGTLTFDGYVKTPLQTLDGPYVNQLKRFMPLAEEGKCLVEEIRKEKEAEQ